MKKNIAVLFSLALSIGSLSAADPVLQDPHKGDLKLGKIDVINFAPGGVLLIGEGSKSRIIALKTGDTTMGAGKFSGIKGFVAAIAGKMGVGKDDLALIDMEVNPASGKLYAAVRNQKTKEYAIIRISPNGEMEPVPTSGVEFVSVPLPKGDKAPVSLVTDVLWIDNRLIASARCNEEFGSKIFSADGPLKHEKAGSVYSAETYHISHGRWETKAPMSVMVPYEEDGKHYVIGAFSCTPVVKYPIDAIQSGAKIKGVSMIELGSGNRPLDMFAYKKNGKSRILTNTFRFHHEKRPYGPSPHLAFRFDEELLGGEKSVNEDATRRLGKKGPTTDKIGIAEDFHGVVQMSLLDQETALALKESGDLVTVALP